MTEHTAGRCSRRRRHPSCSQGLHGHFNSLLITLAGSRMYTSLADTDEVIDDALNRFEAILSSVEGV